MNNNWHYTNNQFITATNRNYKKAFLLSNYHDAALAQAIKTNPDDPDYSLLYNRYHPEHVKYVSVYTKWDSAGGDQQSQTLNVKQWLAKLPAQLDDWELAVQLVYKKNTPAFKRIFPDARNPFYKGEIDGRIGAVNTLAENMSDDSKLSEVKGEVLEFYETVLNARATQDGSKSAKDNKSDDVEAGRIRIMQLQYADTGRLMDKFYTMPEKANAFFDLTLLRGIEQTLFTGSIATDSVKNVFTRTLLATDSLRLKAPGTEGYTAFLGNTATAVAGTGITITAGMEKMVTAADFGVTDLSIYRYLNVQNNNGQATQFEIEIE